MVVFLRAALDLLDRLDSKVGGNKAFYFFKGILIAKLGKNWAIVCDEILQSLRGIIIALFNFIVDDFFLAL